MIHSIIIEDEKNAREALKKIISLLDYPVKIVDSSGLVEHGIEIINKHKPDLVFMDIQLTDGTSFEILDKIINPNLKIIFTTAYDQYAIKAFKYSAIDYLLKPIDPSDLELALKKAIESIKNEEEHQKLLKVLKHNLEDDSKKIVLKTANNRKIVEVNDIIRLEADGAYTIFYTQGEKITISKNIKYYENLLEGTFIRCHQSHLINKSHVIGLYKNDTIELAHDHYVPVSVRKKKIVKEKLRL